MAIDDHIQNCVDDNISGTLDRVRPDIGHSKFA